MELSLSINVRRKMNHLSVFLADFNLYSIIYSILSSGLFCKLNIFSVQKNVLIPSFHEILFFLTLSFN